VQYLRRFYITNSLMTYHPRDIFKTALFFATKTENYYVRLTKFAAELPNTKPEDVLASEFLLTQGLRFTFDVRHPYRALEGAAMELQALASGMVPALPGTQPPALFGDRETMVQRAQKAHGKAREYLKTSALLTDVYFHYTPSQIMFASLLIADPDLTSWYMGTKFPSSGVDSAMESFREKVMMTLEDCANMLKSIPPGSKPTPEEVKLIKGYNKKLNRCRNPEKVDLVALNEKAKRDGMGEDGLEERIAKKRKLEREASQKEGEDLFGPVIKRE
jgi:cyclin H